MKYIMHELTVKDFKIWIVLLWLILSIPILSGYYLKPEDPLFLIILFLILGFFISNFMMRKSLSFKKYFTSQYNPLTSKIRIEKIFDVSKELMFEKVMEVVDDSKFQLVDTDNEKLEILAISSISFLSWGENLYISFETRGDETVMKFCSSTLFQIYSWGKNEKNISDLLNEIESSFTI
jgi:hypothetical protein